MSEEFKMELQAHHAEELKDVEAYEALAMKAKEHGYHTACGILNDIAHDEMTHANALKLILEEVD